MMKSIGYGFATILLLGTCDALIVTEAAARGGGSNFMNSPGYQRRLQESRGYVTNQSGSIVAPPEIVRPSARIKRKYRRR